MFEGIKMILGWFDEGKIDEAQLAQALKVKDLSWLCPQVES